MQVTNELRLKVAAQLLSALLIEDRMAWMKDVDFGNSNKELIGSAVIMADQLIAKIQETGK